MAPLGLSPQQFAAVLETPLRNYKLGPAGCCFCPGLYLPSQSHHSLLFYPHGHLSAWASLGYLFRLSFCWLILRFLRPHRVKMQHPGMVAAGAQHTPTPASAAVDVTALPAVAEHPRAHRHGAGPCCGGLAGRCGHPAGVVALEVRAERQHSRRLVAAPAPLPRGVLGGPEHPGGPRGRGEPRRLPNPRGRPPRTRNAPQLVHVGANSSQLVHVGACRRVHDRAPPSLAVSAAAAIAAREEAGEEGAAKVCAEVLAVVDEEAAQGALLVLPLPVVQRDVPHEAVEVPPCGAAAAREGAAAVSAGCQAVSPQGAQVSCQSMES